MFQQTLGRHRIAARMAADGLSWLVAAVGFGLMRYDFRSAPGLDILLMGIAMAGGYLLLGMTVRLHQGRARVGSLEELMLIGPVALVVGLVAFLINLGPIWVARSLPIGITVCFLVIAAAWRAAWRAVSEPAVGRVKPGDQTRNVLIIGAGQAAFDLVGSILRDPRKQWHPVGLLDDDVYKRHLRVRGVPVIGRIDELDQAIHATDADAVLFAIPSAGPELVTDVNRVASEEGVDVKVLPSTSQLFKDHVGIRDLRDIDLSDVLGRKQLDTDLDAIAGYLTGRRVLVTGAGGSIGSELCRQIAKYAPGQLMMLDRDESALHAVQLSLTGRALLDTDDVILCDIRDACAVRTVFAARQPEVVFHAAALKHLPMLEQYPSEAIKTNIDGTRNVLEAAHATGVDTFVNISTDKAANPTCVLGYSKRIAERLTALYAGQHGGAYLSVRFGNVLGSRGSVLTTFAAQIAGGGPVSVTDAAVTRYFMTIEEACQLVVQAAAIGEAGEALVLDMGEPVRILDVAQQLIRQSGRPIDIEFTGLRPGEKLHEELFADHEPRDVRPRHALISHVPVHPVDVVDVLDLPRNGDQALGVTALVALCASEGLGHSTLH